MTSLLSNIGKKIATFMGSPEDGFKSSLRFKHNSYDQIFKFDTLSAILGYEYVETCEKNGQEHVLVVSRNSVGFVIEATPIVGGSHDLHKTMLELMEELLEESVSIQCLLLADHRVNSILKAHAMRRAHNGELFFDIMRHRAHCFSSRKANACRDFRFLFSVSIAGEPSPDLYNKLIEKQKRSLKTLRDLSYCYSWKAEEYVSNISSFINFSESTIPEKRNFNELEPLSSQIPNGGKITVKEDGIIWEKKNPIKFKGFRAVNYPDYWSITQMNHLIGNFHKDSFRINVPFFIHYGVHCPVQSTIEKSYSIRSSIVEKQGRSAMLCRMIPELVDEVREVDHVRVAQKRGDKFVLTQLSTGYWSNPEDSESVEQTLKSIWKLNNFKLQENRFVHLPSYLSTLPMSWGEYANELKELGLLRTTLSSETVNFVPIQGEWRGTPQPGVLLLGRRGQLCNFNLFDGGTNYNAVVVGQSGSGKSVFMQEILMNNLGTGGRVYVIDVGGSFEKLCEVVNGQKIDFQKTEKLCLNPFSNIPTNDSEELAAYFGALKSIISTMAHPVQGASDLENALIEKAILSVWNEKSNQATITDIARFLESQPESEAKNLSTMLGPFTKNGNYADYFEGKANIDFHNKMVLVELEQLKNMPELQSVILQIFILEINRKIFLGDRKTPTIICIDEAWDLLRAKQTGPFIETLARRLRKYNGSLIVGTQSVEDFYQSAGAMAAYDNSSWTCLLSQKPESVSAYAKKSNCPKGQIEVLESVRKKGEEYSEIMIVSENGYSICRLILDPFSRLLYSTQPGDRKKIEPYRKEGFSVSKAIDELLKTSEKGGIPA